MNNNITLLTHTTSKTFARSLRSTYQPWNNLFFFNLANNLAKDLNFQHVIVNNQFTDPHQKYLSLNNPIILPNSNLKQNLILPNSNLLFLPVASKKLLRYCTKLSKTIIKLIYHTDNYKPIIKTYNIPLNLRLKYHKLINQQPIPISLKIFSTYDTNEPTNHINYIVKTTLNTIQQSY